jgi:hypothetical protein
MMKKIYTDRKQCVHGYPYYCILPLLPIGINGTIFLVYEVRDIFFLSGKSHFVRRSGMTCVSKWNLYYYGSRIKISEPRLKPGFFIACNCEKAAVQWHKFFEIFFKAVTGFL